MEEKTKKIKKCSLCHQAGHIKTNCQAHKLAEINTVGKQVLVSVGKINRRSPHLIDLKNKTQDSVWNSVSVFSEKRAPTTERRVVDLAAMIKAHKSRKITNYTNTKKRVSLDFASPYLAGRQAISYLLLARRSFSGGGSSVIIMIKERIIGIKKWVTNGITSAKGRVLGVFNFKKLAFGAMALLVLATLPFPAIGYYSSVKYTGARVVEASTNAFLSLQS